MVPIRVRLIISSKHDVSGYVVFDKVEGILGQTEQTGCKIKFTNQLEIEVLDYLYTLRENMALSAEMKEYLREGESLA